MIFLLSSEMGKRLTSCAGLTYKRARRGEGGDSACAAEVDLRRETDVRLLFFLTAATGRARLGESPEDMMQDGNGNGAALG